jgi:hypothetical protein
MRDRGLQRARRDAGVFAKLLLNEELWDHQLEVVRSRARYRVICAGRQVGKSRLLAVLALHQAFSKAGSLTLLVSAGEVASRRILSDVAGLALASPLLRGSLVDEQSQVVVLTNGSTIRSVLASQRQIRGWAVDLLIVDEAGFLDAEVWRSAEPAIIARRGSRVVMSSSPWGSADHPFRQLWNRGMSSPDGQVEAWHWPSSTSPLVDQQLLAEIRERETPAYFEREYLSQWSDPAGAYFTQSELEGATEDYPLVDPLSDGAAELGTVCGGIDWGMARDAHALTVIAAREPDERGRARYWVAWCEERFGLGYEAWLDRLVEVAGWFTFSVLSSECNGVGAAPSQILARRLWEQFGRDVVEPVTTSARSKEDCFGYVKLLLQQGRFALPRHPSLLRQLAGLEFTMTEGGLLKIAVPERAGHDDLVMSLCLAVAPLLAGEGVPEVSAVLDAEELWSDRDEYRFRVASGEHPLAALTDLHDHGFGGPLSEAI